MDPVDVTIRIGGKSVRIRISEASAPTGRAVAPSGAAQLRDVEAAALEAAPKHDAHPISVKQLARLAGYKDTGHFREAVRVLVDRGLLVRVRGGLRRPA